MELLGDVGHVESRLIHLEMVLVFVQDRCTVYAKHTIGSDIILDAPNGTPRRCGHVESCSVRVEMVLVLVQDRCTVYAKHTIGSYIILDAPNGTPNRCGSC